MPSDHIPITFEIDGRRYAGELVDVPGRAQMVWDLIIDRFYCGMLVIRNGDFVFHAGPKHPTWEDMAAFFGATIRGWHDGLSQILDKS